MSFTNEDLEGIIRNLFPTTEYSQLVFEEGKSLLASNSRSATLKAKDGTIRNLHLKLCEEDSSAGYLNQKVKTHEKESFFHSELLPKLIAFYEEHKTKSNILDIDLKSLFVGFHGSETVEGKGGVIVLDRFSPEEYFVGELEEFYTLQQVHYCLKSIAAFHATSYTMKQKDGFIWMDQSPLMQHLLFHQTNWDIIHMYLSLLFQGNMKILEAVKKETSKQNSLIGDECAAKFGSLSPNSFGRLQWVAKNLPAILLKTLDCPSDLSIVLHGDFQMWNIAFAKGNNNNDQIHAKFFDFQMTCASSGWPAVLEILESWKSP